MYKKIVYNCSVSAICIPDCENGGTCVSPGKCACKQTFIGDRCQDRKYLSDYVFFVLNFTNDMLFK